MDDAAFQAWLDQHGGEVGRKDNEKEVDGPVNPNTGVASKVTAIDSTTVTAKDGATITLRRNPGPHVGNATVYTVVGNTPPKPSEGGVKEGDIRGPQTGQKREVYRNGQWVTEDNPVYQPPASTTQPQTVSTNTTEPFIVTRMPDGTIKTEKNPNYKGADPKPSSQSMVKGGDGKTYIVSVDANGNVTTKDSGVPADQKPPAEKPRLQDPETKEWLERGDDGVWRPIQRAGQTTGPKSPGPALPTIVVGQSQAALRQYRDQLQAEVAAGRQTQAWADKRWEEAKDTATFAIQEATLLQRERESSLNANVNLATTRLNAETSGIKTALEFATSINGKLPEGSPLGGQAFAALLGLNMLAAKRSGIYDIKPPGSDQRSLEGRGIDAAAGTATATTNSEITRILNPGNPQAVAAQRAEVQAQLEQEAATQATPSAQPITDPRDAGVVPPNLNAPAPPVAPGAPPAPGQPSVGMNPVTESVYGSTTEEILRNVRPNPNHQVTYPTPAAPPVQMAPQLQGDDFAVLSAYRPQQQPQAPQEPVQPQMTPQAAQQEEMPAMRRARIAATPFWRLDDADIQWAEENGFGEDAMRVPSMRVA